MEKLTMDLLLDFLFQVALNWVVLPLLIVFALPFVLFALVGCSAMYFWTHYMLAKPSQRQDPHFWDRHHYHLALFWALISWAWHGYEVIGLENIPDTGPALLVFYHGALPVDWYFLLAHLILHKKRLVNAVGDKFLFKIPGLRPLLEGLKVCTGTVSSCTKVMQEGGLLAISPGGVREALFGDENYQLLWQARVGFARVAIEGKAPIIPVFTQNIREAYCAMSLGRSWLRKIYEMTRLPLVPIYGGFPVKLRTYIGKPIPYDEKMTPQALASKTARAIEELRDQHQVIPGSITRALLDRLQDKAHKCL